MRIVFALFTRVRNRVLILTGLVAHIRVLDSSLAIIGWELGIRLDTYKTF